LERRLAAILAADVAGYTALMGADESGTLERLTDLRQDFLEPLIGDHHGRVVKLMGDGILVEFASVVDAVACALAWQAGAAERDDGLKFRIGINLGDVIVEGEDIYGDGVNVAARLEGLAEPGGICLSGEAYRQTRGKVDAAFEDLGELTLKNVAEPVRVYQSLQDKPAAEQAQRQTAPARRSLGWPALAGGLALLVVAAGVALWQRPWEQREEPASVEAMAFPLPDKPSIAVLPFNNMSEDASQEYFADGMTEDLITDLSKISGLFVIASNSSFSYKGRQVKVRQVAEELGVRYVLEGSVRRAGDQVRINAQLIDATTGGHVWADRYDGAHADVFALQDQVARDIVVALSLRLNPDEQRVGENGETTSVEAYDQFKKGWDHYRKRTPDHYAKALEYFARAVESDPEYGLAHAAMASIYWNSAYLEWQTALGMGRDKAKALARSSIARALKHPTPLAHQVMAQIRIREWEHDDAIAEAERSLSMAPNDADANYALAEALVFSGRPQEALEFLERARRLDPHSEDYYSYLQGLAQFGLGRFKVAASSFERAIELNPDYWEPHPSVGWCKVCELLVATYGHLGHLSDAEAMIQKVELYWPTFNVQSALYWWPYKRSDDRERLADGLTLARLPALR
jgi:TolB-like protein/class 3 adenylate cyclase/Tfp pilus assembly protein PilF